MAVFKDFKQIDKAKEFGISESKKVTEELSLIKSTHGGETKYYVESGAPFYVIGRC